MRNSYKILVGKPGGKELRIKPRFRLEDNIKIGLKWTGYDEEDWIQLPQNLVRCRLFSTRQYTFKFHTVLWTQLLQFSKKAFCSTNVTIRGKENYKPKFKPTYFSPFCTNVTQLHSKHYPQYCFQTLSSSYAFWCFPGEQDYSREEVLPGFQPGTVVLLS